MTHPPSVWILPWWLPLVALVSLASWLGVAFFVLPVESTATNDNITLSATNIAVNTNTPIVEPTTTVLFGGDVMLSRYVGEQIRVHGADWPFVNISAITNAADITFANLEAPFAKNGPTTPTKDTLVFKVEPEAALGLKNAGFAVLSLANNHIMNQGSRGLADTRAILTEQGIAFTGAGETAAQARVPVVLTRNGIRFAFLAYAFPNDGTVATTKRAGIATMDIPAMQADVRAAQQIADVVIVSMHAGTEYSTTVTTLQRTFAQAAIDAGAAFVVGAHPHVVQRVEAYHGGTIAYSLGNFVFDQPFSPATARALMLRVTFTGSALTSVEPVPIAIEHAGQPILATGSVRTQVLTDAEITDAVLINNGE